MQIVNLEKLRNGDKFKEVCGDLYWNLDSNKLFWDLKELKKVGLDSDLLMFAKSSDYHALKNASRYGHVEMVRLLLQIDPKGAFSEKYFALRFASEKGHLEIVKMLLNVDPKSISKSEYRAVSNAYIYKQFDVLKLLLEVDPSAAENCLHPKSIENLFKLGVIL